MNIVQESKFEQVLKPKILGVPVLLLVLLAAALSIRIYNLAGESIWLDESISVSLANSSISNIMENHGWQPYPYHIFLRSWVKVFGDSEFSVRFPSVIFGLLSLLTVYKIGSLLFGSETAFLSTLVTALSVFHLQYSQQARMYSLIMFLAVLSMYYFLRLFRQRSIVVLAGYVFSSYLLIAGLPFGALIIFSQNIYYWSLIRSSETIARLRPKVWIMLQIILSIAVFDWARLFIGCFPGVKGATWWISKPSLISIASQLRQYAGSFVCLALFFTSVIFLFASWLKREESHNIKHNLFFYKRWCWHIEKEEFNKIYFMLLWLFLPITTLLLFSMFCINVYVPRYLVPSCFALYIIVSRGISSINYKYLKFAVITMVVICSLLNIKAYCLGVNNEPWRKVAKYIDENAQNEDLVLILPDYGRGPFNYYSKRRDLRVADLAFLNNLPIPNKFEKLAELFKGLKEIWVVSWKPDALFSEISNHSGKSYDFVFVKEYVWVYWLARNKSAMRVYLLKNKSQT